MYSSLSTRGAQRRRLRGNGNGAGSGSSTCVLPLTIDSAVTNAVRQLVVPLCGDRMSYMRVASCADAGIARVWLCVGADMAVALTAAVLLRFPTARLGPMSNGDEQVLA